MIYNSKHIISLVIFILSVPLYNSSVYADMVKNVRHYRISDDRIVIYYDLDSMEASTISIEVSLDGGKSFTVKPHALSGDVGNDINPGPFKRIVWKVNKAVENIPENFLINVLTDTALKTILPVIEEERK